MIGAAAEFIIIFSQFWSHFGALAYTQILYRLLPQFPNNLSVILSPLECLCRISTSPR